MNVLGKTVLPNTSNFPVTYINSVFSSLFAIREHAQKLAFLAGQSARGGGDLTPGS